MEGRDTQKKDRNSENAVISSEVFYLASIVPLIINDMSQIIEY